MHPLYNLKLEQALEHYKPSSSAESFNHVERAHVLHALDLLRKQPKACFNRKTFYPGHFTGSMWIAQPDFQRVLMIEHPHSKVWMMPGGHADDDPYLLNVALRETEEETGLKPDSLQVIPYGTGNYIFDVDTHYIPPRPVKREPKHLHFDICYLSVYAGETLPPSPEDLPMKWMTLNEVEALSSPVGRRYRCVQKLRHLAQTHA